MIWSYFKQGPSFDLVSRLVDPRAEGFEIIAEFTEIETGKGSDALDCRPELKAALNAQAAGQVMARAGPYATEPIRFASVHAVQRYVRYQLGHGGLSQQQPTCFDDHSKSVATY